MDKIAWITDSMAFFPPGEAEKIGIHVVPTLIIINGESYREYVDLSVEQLDAKMRQDSSVVPTTSQPSFGELVELYERLQAEGYDYAYAVHITSGLSGTYASSVAAADAVGFKLYAVDSYTGGANQQEMLRISMQLAQAGKRPEEVMAVLDQFKHQSHFYLIIGNMETMRRSGRVSSSQFLLANMLNIKPIVKFDEVGKLVPFKKVRSIKKAFHEMTSEIVTQVERSGLYKQTLYIGHTLALSAAEQLRDTIQSKLPHLSIEITQFGPSILTHAGSETVGVFWFDDIPVSL
ncbi:fatty acid-binding protein DegV [Exiguobacterium sp. KRL4]|uniref:DegV family protein n=1 Tax=Exiguobacterium sp. KRL4 TaxID=1914536 RepID=UPI0008F8BCA7|nr:DegV family protein [Exiguobacterium sp. KRL4]OIN67743.1 fatty acid-binding protein DegV [Exiguobacterium sp. KRL4]